MLYAINNAYDSIVQYKPSKKVYFIEGEPSIGKTRFLKEIKFLLKLKGAHNYSSFSLNNLNDDSKVWKEIFRRILLESDKKTLEQTKSEFESLFPSTMDFENGNYSDIIHLDNLNVEQTSEMIKDMLIWNKR